MLIIAKAYGNKPLKRYVCGVSKKLIYIGSKSVTNSPRSVNVLGVGFHAKYIYQYDSVLLENLSKAWELRDAESLDKIWKTASLIDVKGLCVANNHTKCGTEAQWLQQLLS